MEIISALLLGSLLGFSLERSGFCMNTAFRSILFDKDRSILRAYILALLITTVGVSLLDDFRLIFPQRSPFSLPALLVGGFTFGVGMVTAGGCVSGTYYRSGRGMLGSVAALIAFFLSASLFSSGPLGVVSNYLQSFIWTLGGEEPALYHLLPLRGYGAAKWSVITLLVMAGGFFLIKAPREEFLISWSWKRSGLIIGLIATAAWLISGFFHRDYGLSFTQPSVSLARYVVDGDSGGINWASFSVIGVLAGAFLSALLQGEFLWRLPEPGRLVRQFGGGLLMGTGAAIGGGCNIGHGLTGISALSLASVTATVFTILGCWSATALIYRQEQRRARPGKE